MSCWTTETEKIIDAHKADFDSTNWQDKLKSYGGYTAYLKQLGGVFAKYAGRNAAVKTVAQFQDVAQYVFGLMAIFGFNYNNGSFTVHWAGGSPFYPSADDGRCNWGEIDSLCSDPDKAKTTNCNFGMDSFYYKAGLMPGCTEVSDLFRWQGRTYKVIRNIADLKVGDLVHMFGERVTSDDPSTWEDWHHVCCVGERQGSEVIMYDTGSRFISSGNFKIPFKVDRDNEPAGSYSSYHGWVGIHMVDLAGSAKTGWIKDAKGWRYQFSDGSCATGWQKLKWSKGTDWFYFDEVSGAMVTGWRKCKWSGGTDWFFFDWQNGDMQTGWRKVAWSGGTSWFYFEPIHGDMQTGWKKLKWSGGTNWFYFDRTNGNMLIGWQKINGSWYFLNTSHGFMQTGWMDWRGRRCYLDPITGKACCNCVRVIDGKTYRFDGACYATEISPTTQTIDRSKKFIDVSEFQNDIDWSKASKVVGAAYIRCGLRGSLAKTAPQDYKKIRYDKKWAINLAEAQKYGIPFSAYYFPTAITDAEALEGAKWFYEQVQGLNLAFPPALDSENVWGKNKEAGRANGLSKAERTRLLKIVTNYFNERGMNIGIYASALWLTSKIDMSAFPQCVRDCTWVADSTGAVDYKSYYWLYQYGKGACAGFGGDVDLNRITGNVPPVRNDGKPQTEQPTEGPIDVLIRIMEAEVGTHEGPNNHTKYGDEMHAIQPSNMDKNAPWCDSWFDWCVLQLCKRYGKDAETARAVLCGDFDDYTYNSVALYKKAGRWTQTPARGYQIFFGGSGHTGGVVKVDGGIVYTIEGNKSDQVKACQYKVGDSSIIGYGQPRYELLTGGTYKVTAADMPLIKRGATGSAVTRLQEMLNAATYRNKNTLEVDGSFGPKTQAQVIHYQMDRGLDPDGEVGPITWGALFAE